MGWHRYARGPSRLVWFFVGAFSATWFWKHKYNYHARVKCSRPDLPADSYAVPPVYPPQYYPPAPHGAFGSGAAAAAGADNGSAPTAPAVETAAPAPPPPPVQSQPQQPEQPRPEKSKEWSWSWRSNHSPPPPPNPPVDHRWDDEAQKRWEEERQRMQNAGRQATDTFTEFSEATLDTILSTVEGMKAKLAEHRASRERQIREWQTWREEQIRQLDEWKKQQAAAEGRYPYPSPPPPVPHPTSRPGTPS